VRGQITTRGARDQDLVAWRIRAVAIGRPVLYGLALGGWMGVQGVFQHLDGELEMTNRLAGARTISEISRRYVSVSSETAAAV